MKIYNYLQDIINSKGAAYLVLLDPDKITGDRLPVFVKHCEKNGVDAFLMGGSLMLNNNFESFIKKVKENSKLPAIIFPGSIHQISNAADAIFYLSVISGRNPEHLIGKHVLAAPLIKEAGIEPISTGYILVESGVTTTAQYMSGSLPIPRDKPEIVVATALAAEYLGMRLIYLEAGSGAESTVPDEMIKKVTASCRTPVIVGGGIKTPAVARRKIENGAKIIVTGNLFENENNWDLVKDFAEAIHINKPMFV